MSLTLSNVPSFLLSTTITHFIGMGYTGDGKKSSFQFSVSQKVRLINKLDEKFINKNGIEELASGVFYSNSGDFRIDDRVIINNKTHVVKMVYIVANPGGSRNHLKVVYK